MEVGFLQPACPCIAAVGSYSSKQSLATAAFVTGWTVAVVVENYIRVRAFSVSIFIIFIASFCCEVSSF